MIPFEDLSQQAVPLQPVTIEIQHAIVDLGLRTLAELPNCDNGRPPDVSQTPTDALSQARSKTIEALLALTTTKFPIQAAPAVAMAEHSLGSALHELKEANLQASIEAFEALKQELY